MENDVAKVNLSAIGTAINVVEHLKIDGFNIENKDLLERAVGFIENTANTLIVTEETLDGGKSSRKELNRAATSVDEKRKEIKKSFEEPLKVFEKQMNGYRDRIKSSVSKIDIQIKKFEEQERNDRLREVNELIAEMAPNYDVSPQDVVIDKRWLNKSISKKQRLESIASSMKTLASEQKIINETEESVVKYCQKFDIDPEGFKYLVGTFDLVTIMNRIDEAVELKKNRIKAEKQAEIALVENQKKELEQFGDKLVNVETGQLKHVEQRISFTIQGLPEDVTELAKFIKINKLKVLKASVRQEVLVED